MSGTFLIFGEPLTAASNSPAGMAVLLVVLFAVILGSALAVVRHAEHLSEYLGDPYGTLILTVSVAFIEVVSISAVITHGDNNPTLVRDSLLSVVMIILNGMVGASLLIGAWRHREQSYNLQGANTYLGVIIPLVVLSLVMPTYTKTTAGPTLSVAQADFLILMSVALYGAFLAIQTGRHRGYFVEHGESDHHAAADLRERSYECPSGRGASAVVCSLSPADIPRLAGRMSGERLIRYGDSDSVDASKPRSMAGDKSLSVTSAVMMT